MPRPPRRTARIRPPSPRWAIPASDRITGCLGRNVACDSVPPKPQTQTNPASTNRCGVLSFSNEISFDPNVFTPAALSSPHARASTLAPRHGLPFCFLRRRMHRGTRRRLPQRRLFLSRQTCRSRTHHRVRNGRRWRFVVRYHPCYRRFPLRCIRCTPNQLPLLPPKPTRQWRAVFAPHLRGHPRTVRHDHHPAVATHGRSHRQRIHAARNDNQRHGQTAPARLGRYMRSSRRDHGLRMTIR